MPGFLTNAPVVHVSDPSSYPVNESVCERMHPERSRSRGSALCCESCKVRPGCASQRSDGAMTRLNASLVGLVALTLVAVSERVHGQCVVFEDPADMFRRADAVFVGTVRRTEPTGALGHHIVMHRASFEIEQVWKGQPKKFETVGTVEAFEPGKRYLVFAGAASTEESRAREGSFQTSL